MAQSHQLREQLRELQAQETDIKAQLAALESEIKARLDALDKDYENLTEEEFQLLMVELANPMKVTVEVVYASSDVQFINEVELARGATIEDVIVLSGVLEQYPVIDLSKNKVGIFGAIKPLTEKVNEGDRIEIYRPVTAKT